VNGKNFAVTFNKKAGTITDLSYYQTPVIVTPRDALEQAPPEPELIYWPEKKASPISGPRLNIFRAPTDNDYIFGRGPGLKWVKEQLYALNTEVLSFEAGLNENNTVVLSVNLKSTSPTGYSVTTQTRYTVYGDGTIRVYNLIKPEPTTFYMAKIGFIIRLPEGFEQVDYFGAGPHENYPDRNRSAAIGRYSTTVDEMFVPYIRPQDCGNRTSVRWASVTNHSGVGILIEAENQMNFSALHFTPLDLHKANHPYELTKRKSTILTIDLDQCGLGGGSCGPPPLERYQIMPDQAEFTYFIKPAVQTWL
jgi:beta-galactosidase